MIPIVIAVTKRNISSGSGTGDLTTIEYPIYNGRTTASSGTTASEEALSPTMTVIRPIASNERIVRLFLEQSDFSDTNTRSLHDADNANYQVPTGYTAKIILIVRSISGTGATVEVKEHNVADTNGGTLKYDSDAVDTLDDNTNVLLTISPEWDGSDNEESFAAGNFINIRMSTTSTQGIVVAALVIETPV